MFARLLLLTCLLAVGLPLRAASSAQELFTRGSEAYDSADYARAVTNFQDAAALATTPTTLHNLGDAEWQLGHTGPAILAWEQALWLDPYAEKSHENLRFARKARLLDAPELVWYEICSTWLPVNVWPWIASLSLWLAIALVILPGALRWRKASWHQALAAAGFAVFLLTVPALVGIQTRARIGVIQKRDVNLRLTPTSEGQPIAKLAAGETVRYERRRGQYIYVRTSATYGWIERSELAFIAR